MLLWLHYYFTIGLGLPLEQPFNALHAEMLCDTARLLIAIVCNIISEPVDSARVCVWWGGGVVHAPSAACCFLSVSQEGNTLKETNCCSAFLKASSSALTIQVLSSILQTHCCSFFQLVCSQVFLWDGKQANLSIPRIQSFQPANKFKCVTSPSLENLNYCDISRALNRITAVFGVMIHISVS